MNQTLAVWVLIILALLSANLPFLMERPFLSLPWAQSGEAPQPVWARWLTSIAFFASITGTGYLALRLVGQAFFVASDLASVAFFVAKVAFVVGLALLVLAYPGWRSRGRLVQKSFFVRLLELLVFYGLVGVLGFAFETNMGNTFAQTWEFYAITLSLFLVLGYPGFVIRYLMRHRKPRIPSAASTVG